MRRPYPRVSPATLVLLCCFVITAVLVSLGVTLPGDDAILRAAGRARTDQLTAIMRFFTLLGSGDVEIPFAFAVLGWLFWRGRKREARWYFVACTSGELLYAVAKLIFRRPRPQIIPHLTDGGWYSFPSGHAMLAPIIYALGFALLVRNLNRPWLRAVSLGLGVILPVAVAISRVYLGVHYPSDVVAGLFLGGAWALFWGEEMSRESSPATSSAPATR